MAHRHPILTCLLAIAIFVTVADARGLVFVGQAGGMKEGWFELSIISYQKEHTKEIYDLDMTPFLQEKHSGYKVSSPEGSTESFVCNTCLDISTFAEQVLEDPDTLGNIVEYVNESICNAISGFQKECISLAKIYAPHLVETLEVYAAPDKLCGATKLCPSYTKMLFNDANTCKMCTNFLTEALSYIQSDKTESEIIEVLHSQCYRFGVLSSQCNAMIDTYAPIYIEKIDSITADQVCEEVGMCNSLSKTDPGKCATCEFAVFQLKAKLQNPEVQEKALETLIASCSKIPAHEEQCKELITQYGPFILANIGNYVDPEAICTEIHACESRKKLSNRMHTERNFNNDLLIRLPVSDESMEQLNEN